MSNTQSFKCSHIFHDGHSCGSPALRNEHFCYYHHQSRKPCKGPRLSDAPRAFELPIPEDRSAIQASIATVLQRLAAGCLDAQRAAILLRGLKLASQVLPRIDPRKSLQPVTELLETEADIKPDMELEVEPQAVLGNPDALAAVLRSLQAVAQPPSSLFPSDHRRAHSSRLCPWR